MAKAPVPNPVPNPVVEAARVLKALSDRADALKAQLKAVNAELDVHEAALVQLMLDAELSSFRGPEIGMVVLSQFLSVTVEKGAEEKAWEALKSVGLFEGIVKLAANPQTLKAALKTHAEAMEVNVQDLIDRLNTEQGGGLTAYTKPRIAFRA